MKKITIRLYAIHDYDLICLYKTKGFDFISTIKDIIFEYSNGGFVSYLPPIFSEDMTNTKFKGTYKICFTVKDGRDDYIKDFLSQIKKRQINSLIKNLIRQSFLGRNISSYGVNDQFRLNTNRNNEKLYIQYFINEYISSQSPVISSINADNHRIKIPIYKKVYLAEQNKFLKEMKDLTLLEMKKRGSVHLSNTRNLKNEDKKPHFNGEKEKNIPHNTDDLRNSEPKNTEEIQIPVYPVQKLTDNAAENQNNVTDTAPKENEVEIVIKENEQLSKNKDNISNSNDNNYDKKDNVETLRHTENARTSDEHLTGDSVDDRVLEEEDNDDFFNSFNNMLNSFR